MVLLSPAVHDQMGGLAAGHLGDHYGHFWGHSGRTFQLNLIDILGIPRQLVTAPLITMDSDFVLCAGLDTGHYVNLRQLASVTVTVSGGGNTRNKEQSAPEFRPRTLR